MGNYVSPLSIKEQASINFEIYPNPTNGTLYLNGIFNNNTELICMNVLGDIVYKELLVGINKEWTIDFSFLPTGVYSIKVSNAEGTAIKKFIKE